MSSLTAWADAPISGRLLEKGTRKPMMGVNVFILPHKLKATTNDRGEFRFPSVPTGEFQFVVNQTDYQRLVKWDEIYDDEDDAEVRVLYLERTSYLNVYETTIVDQGEKRDDSKRSLKAEVFKTLPGAGGDPVKAVQNLPGVNRSGGFDSRVVIQGSAPQDTRYTIDGHEVPLVFHFGGLTSVTSPEGVEQVDYLSAGYGPEFGRALGGVVNLKTKDPRTDRLHGVGFLDLFNAGIFLEGPIGEDSGFYVGARQSYIGEAFKAISMDNDDFDLTVAPTYSDLSILYTTKLSPIDDFRVFSIASRDTLEFVLSEPIQQDPEIRGNFFSQTTFFRIIPQLTHKHSAITKSRWSLGLGYDDVNTDIGDNFFKLTAWDVTPRIEVERKVLDSWTTFVGLDSRFRWANVRVKIPSFFTSGGVNNPLSSGEAQETAVIAWVNASAVYMRNLIKLGDWELMPNVRGDYFYTTKEFHPVPRPALRYHIDPHWFIRFASGIYYQAPQPQELAKDFGNENLKANRAYHAALSTEIDFRRGSSKGLIWTVGGFYRHFDRLVISSTDTVERDGVTELERYSNEGKGRAFGGESLLRLEWAPFTGWLAYTISKSTRWDPNTAEALFQYDQTHNVNAVLSWKMPRNWQISGRVRYVTGNPFTPINGGTFDADNDSFIPSRGEIFSERVEPFFQVDFRVDKKWVFDTWILSAYLDIQNLLNAQNVESVSYSYDYTQTANVTGLPMLPTLGLKGEF